ncbi:MAG: hypothetical protein H6707_04550 [Deltaproteobacteria bacterium]|nr:hypothetical protein [Deltaproteobacteria bacterium]
METRNDIDNALVVRSPVGLQAKLPDLPLTELYRVGCEIVEQHCAARTGGELRFDLDEHLHWRARDQLIVALQQHADALCRQSGVSCVVISGRVGDGRLCRADRRREQILVGSCSWALAASGAAGVGVCCFALGGTLLATPFFALAGLWAAMSLANSR